MIISMPDQKIHWVFHWRNIFLFVEEKILFRKFWSPTQIFFRYSGKFVFQKISDFRNPCFFYITVPVPYLLYSRKTFFLFILLKWIGDYGFRHIFCSGSFFSAGIRARSVNWLKDGSRLIRKSRKDHKFYPSLPPYFSLWSVCYCKRIILLLSTGNRILST